APGNPRFRGRRGCRRTSWRTLLLDTSVMRLQAEKAPAQPLGGGCGGRLSGPSGRIHPRSATNVLTDSLICSMPSADECGKVTNAVTNTSSAIATGLVKFTGAPSDVVRTPESGAGGLGHHCVVPLLDLLDAPLGPKCI